MTADTDALFLRRKRLRFRSWHRGIREMDLILGRYADAYLDGLPPDQLDIYELILEIPDQSIYDMLVRGAPHPPEVAGPLFDALIHFANSTPLER